MLAQLKAEPRTRAIPVLIMSVIDERSRGLALGAAEYLVKPVVRADLQRVLPALAPRGVIDSASAARDRPARARQSRRRWCYWPKIMRPTCTMIADYLGTRGYQVVVARNGAEALARATRGTAGDRADGYPDAGHGWARSHAPYPRHR